MNILVDIVYGLAPIVIILLITFGYKMKQYTFKEYSINRIVSLVIISVLLLMIIRRHDIEYLKYLKLVFVNYLLIGFLFNYRNIEFELKTDKLKIHFKSFSDDYTESEENNTSKEEG